MSNQESGDLLGGREGYSEPGRGEQGRGNEELGQPGGALYGQGRQAEEPWRPGQSDNTEGSSFGGTDSTSGTSGSSTSGSSAGTSGAGGTEEGSSKGGSTTKSSNR